jgi:hypothetical protein
MRDKLKKIVVYIFRSWEDEPNYPHPQIRFIPPFFFELITYLIALAILYKISLYLWSII